MHSVHRLARQAQRLASPLVSSRVALPSLSASLSPAGPSMHLLAFWRVRRAAAAADAVSFLPRDRRLLCRFKEGISCRRTLRSCCFPPVYSTLNIRAAVLRPHLPLLHLSQTSWMTRFTPC